MAEDYRILKEIAGNSGRESFITDDKYELLWTNSERTLTSVILGLRVSMHGRIIDRETTLPCSDGHALRITPVKSEGRTRYYFFELYGSAELLSMLSATSVFGAFADAAGKMRYSMLDYSAALETYTDTCDNTRLGAGSVNFISILKILGGEELSAAEDITARLRQTASWFSALSARTEGFVFDADIDEELYAVTERSSLEYAVVNLIMNACIHSVPPEGAKRRIKLTACLDSGSVVIDIEDNGISADAAYVDGFREVFLEPSGERAGEGLGVSLAEIFCRKYGGSLGFSPSPMGGLRARMKLPSADIRRGLTLYAPSYECPDIRSVRDIMAKAFASDDIDAATAE